MKTWLAAALIACLGMTGCGAPYDDGEVSRTLGAARPPDPSATPVVVDTDLGGDDLAALAFLLRHPSVKVEAVTIAATGLVGCDAGVDVVAGLFAAVEARPVPVACGRPEAGPEGRQFPTQWRQVAERGTGITPVPGAQSPGPAGRLIAALARQVDGLVVVALGPLTNLGDLARKQPRAYARLAGVHAMAGSVDGRPIDGIAEWNAAVDPAALETVLAGRVPVTLVPEDAVPAGTPGVLAGPVLGRIAEVVDYPQWGDLSAAAAFVEPHAGKVEWGRWLTDSSGPGRLRRAGAGRVKVYRSLDGDRLAAAYEEAFAR